MPKRATITFASEDTTSDELHVYYCKYSGRHVLSTDCNLAKAPKRRTDGSLVLDTEFYVVNLYTSEGSVKLIKRKNGSVEKQYRLNVDNLPVAYRSETEGRFLYIFKDALLEYKQEKERRPVPPCIAQISHDTVKVTLEVDDRATNTGLIKISSDFVRVQIMQGIGHEKASEELLEFMRNLLGVRLGQLSIVRGESTRQKLLMVQDMVPEIIFDKLENNI